MEKFDVIVIGSGPGGYVAAIRCAQLGLSTAIVEKYNTLGGTCLNVGCIPSKALLDSSEHFKTALHDFDKHGIDINTPKVNLPKMMARKQEVISQTCDGVQYLMDKNKIKVFHGMGSFKDKNIVNIDGEKKESIYGEKIIIATGSKPNFFPGMVPDKNRIITSTEALSLKEVPKHLIIIGGGVIGLELGSVYGRLGSEVTVVEFQDGLLPTMDKTLGKELMKILKKEGFKFLFNHAVQKVNAVEGGVQLDVKNKKEEIISIEGDYCLVAVGRKAYTDQLGLENIGIETDKAGRIVTDNNLMTSENNVYAIGDVVKGAMLAHKAEEEGVFVAEHIANQKPHIDYNLVPGVVYTWPEVASVGKTEQELLESNVDFKIGQFPIRALGRARASMDIQGLIKIISDSNNDEVLGVHMIAPRAADLIMEAVVAMEYRASAEDIARICHPHPTYSEAVKEAALSATENRPLHI
ncbi:MAG: dihydrolipoyl dehydrogenase [Crocinitomicaceae bacterium]|nr:dihydrolipoyl dehydrogenase [Crocinitomicaceae bacterium]|tara:strand:- start:5856 stop:7253 length:1398 start_codon:yes stop_codon:yes gene_type:complete